ncbi:uncharacterized protein LOC128861018 [Anastrepha ludens]|uniref:uncharacterized protein LOC128861018 n=1 Tax=Anastrepha ludens TaxID=28586 RepID=UPI0023AEB9D9|nr:uncharacterized protein LOC128861018 [Anastrepha ludens]
MAALPENLQVVKTEGAQLPETEAQPRRLIKERLNLHVKRRLQQEHEPQAQLQKIQIITHPSGNTARETLAIAVPLQSPQSSNVNVNFASNDVTPATSTPKRKEKQQQKEPVKTRRPYQRRADKNTTNIQTQMQINVEDGARTGRSRKNKRHKQQGLLAGITVPSVGGNAVPSGGAGALCLSPGVEEGSGGGIDEMDGRDICSRDKEKCPDILGMVLSGKKRALMQNAEVQEFLSAIMSAFKN